MGENKTRSIRAHLLQLVLLGIVPVGILAAALLHLHSQAQEAQRERAQLESVRLLAAAVDNAIDSSIARLQIFAQLWAGSDLGDEAVYRHARQMLAANADWANVIAFRADGSATFRTDRPFGHPVPPMQLSELWRPVVEELRPLVSDVITSPATGRKVVSVGVPVVRGGRATHVVIAAFDLRWFDSLLERQGLAEGGVAGIFDRNFKFVARSREGDERRGTDGAAPLIADMKRMREGVGRYESLNALPVYTAWTPSRHGWWVAAATPAGPIDSAFWNYLGLFGFVWLATVVAAILFAVAKGRRVAASLEEVEARAASLGGGRALAPLRPSEIHEVQRALVALDGASRVVQEAMETEREARATAEAASRAKDEFLALLGHELRNPLAAISNASHILSIPGHSPAQAELAMGVIGRQSQHLKRLIDDLLDVGRVMNGKIALEREPMDVAACARQAVRTLETAGRLAGRRVEVDAQSAWVDGDATRIEQIIVNLLVNAAAHTRDGGHIRLRVREDAKRAVIEVRDDGVGIEPRDLPRVFELFFQANATSERARGGLGIGLTLVRRLAELHGGVVTVESAGRESGATFAVRLPAIEAPARVETRPSTLQAVTSTKVLVVDDNADQRETLRVALELQGHHVLQAEDGPSALEVIRRERPAVAVLDIGLPGMDGYRVAMIVRKELGRSIALIALTGYGTEAAARDAERAGFDLHLTKPVAPEDLAHAVGVMSPAEIPFPRRAAAP
ncbi:MAG TPA: ATP-binding protein [Burkholderiales bacterium]|nr:ATP-binding protein [Burkholderiales bacterium]